MKYWNCAVIVVCLIVLIDYTIAASNTWAVIVCTSRYWFNYRHLTNALTVYWAVRDLGIPDDKIILMNAHADASVDLRNSIPGTIISNSDEDAILTEMMKDAKFDYLGNDVNSKSLTQVLTGRHEVDTHKSKMMSSDENSNILIYLSGHGGDEFLKFHDNEEISATDFQSIFMEMHLKKRYKSVLFIVETCQASSLSKLITAPSVYSLTSSLTGENSYSYYANSNIGVSVIDRFTFSLGTYFHDDVIQYQTSKKSVQFTVVNNQMSITGRNDDNFKGNKLKKKITSKRKTFQSLLNHFDPNFLHSTASLQVSGNISTVITDVRGLGHEIAKLSVMTFMKWVPTIEAKYRSYSSQNSDAMTSVVDGIDNVNEILDGKQQHLPRDGYENAYNRKLAWLMDN